MKYNFKDIVNNAMYSTAQVVFICGPYGIFNNIVSDKLKDLCKGKIENVDTALFQEFELSAFESDSTSNSVDLLDFFELVKMPAISGKWYCLADYKMLTKKQVELVKRYYKHPSENGVLILLLREFADYKDFIRDKYIAASQNVHLIQLSFPNRKVLVELVTELFSEHSVKVAPKAVELFVMRMSTSYDEYAEIIERISLNYKNGTITYSNMVEELKGIDNFVLDDFLEQLTEPIKSDKIVTTRKIYKMESAMLADMGAKKLVEKLKYKINDLIEMRKLINSGIVPIRVRFSVDEAKRRMGENHPLYKLSDFSFRRMAYLASKTSLWDWTFMRMVLDRVNSRSTPAEYERVIQILVNRTRFCEDRRMNDIGVSDIISRGLLSINSTPYILGEQQEVAEG